MPILHDTEEVSIHEELGMTLGDIKDIEREARLVCTGIFGNDDCWKVFAEEIYQNRKQMSKDEEDK